MRPPWGRRNPGYWSTATAAGGAVFESGVASSTAGAGLFLSGARDFGDYFAGFGIVFADGVLADVNETFAVDGHAVALRGVEGADDVTGFIDVDHGRGADAAIGDGRGELGFELDVGEVVGAIEDPDVVVFVDGEAGNSAELPFVGEGLGPIGIELEFGRGGGLG